jgi:alpha-methylacyl-CoA racemase
MGPLAGVKIVELGGIGPAPYCCMLLSDLGADIVRIDRIVASDSGIDMDAQFNLLHRGRRSVAMDLKNPASVQAIKRLVADADAIIEGFRPGVAERLGLGPDACLSVNPRIVFGRMTGYGQTGPLASAPGHDINYIALSGVLHSIGQMGGPPLPPLNLVGDFGGGALFLVMGVLAGIIEARASGQGQVVDAAMIDGAASLMSLFYGMRAAGVHGDVRGTNRLDGSRPWYATYQTKDGGYIALGSNEPRFFKETVKLLGLEASPLCRQDDPDGWDALRELFAGAIRQKTRDEWCALAAGHEVCLSPVLSLGEAPSHPQNRLRDVFVERDGVVQPAPAPRFSRTPGAIRSAPARPGEHTIDALRDWGFSNDDLDALADAGAIQTTGAR